MESKKEQRDTLLRALRDPKNRHLKTQIKRALMHLGMRDVEITYYEMTGRLPEWVNDELDMRTRDFDIDVPDFDIDDVRDQMIQRRRSTRKAFRLAIVGGMLIIIIMTGIMIGSLVSDPVAKREPPAITDTSDSDGEMEKL